MTKDLLKLIEKVKIENRLYVIKIIIRESSHPGVFRLSLQRNLPDGKKESRSIDLSLEDSLEQKNQNKTNIEIAREMRSQLESERNRDEAEGKYFSLNKKIISDNFLDYFEKIAAGKNQRNYRICKEHFTSFVGTEYVAFTEINNELCRSFVQYLKSGNNRTERTAHNYFVCFKAVLNLAVIDELLSVNPAANIKIKYPRKEKGRLTYNQLRVLFDTPCINSQLKNAFLFSCFTGLRKSDIAVLKYSDIKEGYIVLITKKTKTPVKIKLNRTATMILEQQKQLIKKTFEYCRQRKLEFDKERLFSFPQGGRSTLQLRNWFKKAGIQSESITETEIYSFHTIMDQKFRTAQ